MQIWQILLLTLLAFLKKVDQKGPQILIYSSIIWGSLAGIIMGDFQTGLYIGGMFQLMSLGVAAIGGTSIPDYQIGAIISTGIAVSTGQGIEAGIAVGLPVGILCVQFDIIVNVLHGYFVRMSQDYCNKKEFRKMNLVLWVCPLLTGLSVAIPTFLAVAFGTQIVNAVLDFMPLWFTEGLSLAGKILPIVGLAVLLQYMPVKKYFEYILIGFILSAYLNLPILAIAGLGFALAYMLFKTKMQQDMVAASNYAGGDEDE